MKTTESSLKGIISLAMAGIIIAAFGAGTARAATVIHYDSVTGNYTGGKAAPFGGTNNPHFTLPTPVDNGKTRTWKYSDTTPISPTNDYTGPAIYTALQTVGVSSAQDFWYKSGINNGLGTTNSFVVAGEYQSTVTAMVFFKPTVNLGETVSFDATSSIILNMLVAQDSHTNWFNENLRFVVQNEGLWYISQSPFYTSTNTTWTLTNVGSANFASFDPEDKAPLPTIPASGYTSLGSSFTNITGVGFYADSFGRTNNYPYMSLTDFAVNATVVPEPVTAALLVFAAVSVLVFARRRKSTFLDY